MQKSPLQYRKIIFQSKVIPLFLPYMGNTLDYLPYMVETVGKKKKQLQRFISQ